MIAMDLSKLHALERLSAGIGTHPREMGARRQTDEVAGKRIQTVCRQAGKQTGTDGLTIRQAETS